MANDFGQEQQPIEQVGLSLFDESELTFSEDKIIGMKTKDNLISTPFGLLKASLHHPTEEQMDDKPFDDDSELGEDMRFAVHQDGIVFEDSLRNLVNNHYAGLYLGFDSNDKVIRSLPQINLWLEGTNFKAHSPAGSHKNWGTDPNIDLTATTGEVDLTNFTTPDGKQIDAPWFPINPKVVSRLRINFETPTGGDVN